jgi:hypothetical protein
MCVLIVAFVDCISLGTAAWASDGVMFNEIPNLPPYLKYVYPEGWGNIKWGDAPEKLGDDRILLSSYKITSKDINMEIYKKQNELKMLGDFKIQEIIYTFANSKLDSMVVIFRENMPFEKIKKFLVDQYSKPIVEDGSITAWHDLTTNIGISLVKEKGQNLKILLTSATLYSLKESIE